MRKITPHLWSDSEAHEAAEFLGMKAFDLAGPQGDYEGPEAPIGGDGS